MSLSILSVRKFILFNIINFLLFSIVGLFLILFYLDYSFIFSFFIGFIFGVISAGILLIQNKIKKEKIIPFLTIIRIFLIFVGLSIAAISFYYLNINYLYILLSSFEILINYSIIIIIKWREAWCF